jgi:hypothetical protein
MDPFSQIAQAHCALYEYVPVLSDVIPHPEFRGSRLPADLV